MPYQSTMEQTHLITYGIITVLGLIFGVSVARSSSSREAVLSGSPATIFHYLASSIMSVFALTVLASVFIVRMHFMELLVLAVGMFVVALVLLMIYAVLEKPAIDKKAREEDTGWTEQDARTSGL